MKTALIALSFAFAALPAAAFDRDDTIRLINDANYSCTSGENHDGEKLDDAAIIVACQDTVRLLSEMKANGFCYDKAKVDWIVCK